MSAIRTSSISLGHYEQQKHDSAREPSLSSHCYCHSKGRAFYTLEDLRDHVTLPETWQVGNEHSSPESSVFPENQDSFSSDPLAVSIFDPPHRAIVGQETTEHGYDWGSLTGDPNLHPQLASSVDSRVLMPLDGTATALAYSIGGSTTLVPLASGDDCRESESSAPPTLSLSPARSQVSGARSLAGTAQAKKHNMAEKKYRASIKDSFQLLRDSLPDLNEVLYNTRGERIIQDWQRQCSFQAGGRLNKASVSRMEHSAQLLISDTNHGRQILRTATEYIQLLEYQNKSLRDRLSECGGFVAES